MFSAAFWNILGVIKHLADTSYAVPFFMFNLVQLTLNNHRIKTLYAYNHCYNHVKCQKYKGMFDLGWDGHFQWC